MLRMMRLIIVEGHIEHRERLMGLIDWGQFGYEIVGEYGDGITAMEGILKFWPDLVITNCFLPDISGIELIERVLDHGFSTEFVIAENTGNFETAQAAMRIGVQEYLIKPLNGETLTRVLQKYAERKFAINSDDINEHFLQTRRLLRNSFMDRFTTYNASENFSIEELNDRYHFKFRAGVFQCASVVVRNLPKDEAAVFFPSIVANVRARFDPLCYEMIPYIHGTERLTFVFNYSHNSKAKARLPELEKILTERLMERKCIGVTYSIGFGIAETGVTKLTQAYDTSGRAMRCGMLREQNKQYFYETLEFDKLASIDILTQTLVGDMNSAAEALNIIKFEKAVRNAFSPTSPRTNPGVVMDIAWAAVEAVGEVCRLSGEDILQPMETKKVLDKLGACPTLQVMISGLVGWAKSKFEHCLKDRAYTRPVRDAQRYIQKHFSQPLTLEFMAKQVHLNASYFSTAFKRETGKNFSEYLSACRVNEAKRLLRESNLSVSQICAAVGYVDIKHFSRLFAKSVGLRPSEYRSLHG